MKNIIYKVSLALLIIMIGCLSFSIYNTLNNKENKNEEIKIDSQTNIFENRSASLAIQIQNDNDNGWHEADNRNAWPDKSIYTWGGAECTDSEGSIINYQEVLSFDTDTFTATVNTKNSVYCTLYFTKGKPALNVLRDNQQGTGAQTFQTSAVDGLIRYKGTASQVNNNYICFGTNNPDTCKATPGTFMFRIIGIQATANTTLGIPANSLKIIKASKYSSDVVWNGNTGVTWDGASVNTSTLPAYYNTISTTNNGVNWKNLILQNHYWYIGDSTNSSATSEATTKSTTTNPTGLMYKSDYINANGQATTNWLFIQNGWSGNAADFEWTMSRDNYGTAWRVNSNGTLYDYYMYDTYAVRPVFYLVSDIKLTGKGTTTDPYIITNKA